MADEKGGNGADAPFWEKPLSELTRTQWEKLCDGCGRCCLVKLEDEDNGRVYHTSVSCRMLDRETGLCGDYKNRRDHVPDCVRLTLKKLQEIDWLPPTCAYVLRNEGRPLPPWHPLISGDPETVYRAGVSVRGKVEVSEAEIEEEETPDYIRVWPKRWPKKARY
ncbi:YcgN family cysteine cluster protein [Methylocystis parvus]|uniref:UPF0260 protein F7D14_10675 n=1 Tax=Methylocystis parvus TaxID=134 RepID=A0A6B8M5Z9_9HYPH|nr:YcgN family cysteine cluster protein [Methylocystis parvus]QGM97888.1 YcgN family cysteine cluster protein [Methylocystis parvus]WBK01801.1 YcgN family cysteine cluster protein [Methylocystis parvus OBBP]